MSEETKKEDITQQKDPNELPPGFFEQEDIDAEDEFIEKFQPPGIGPKGIQEEDITQKKGPEEEEEDDDDDVQFEFDETLAEAEKKELEELNQKLGTNFTDLADLKKALDTTSNKEQLSEIEESNRYIAYYKSVLDYSSEEIIRQDAKIKAQQQGKDINDQDWKDELEMKIEKMKDSEMIDYAGDSLKASVRTELAKHEEKVRKFNDQTKQTEEAKKATFKENLQ